MRKAEDPRRFYALASSLAAWVAALVWLPCTIEAIFDWNEGISFFLGVTWPLLTVTSALPLLAWILTLPLRQRVQWIGLPPTGWLAFVLYHVWIVGI